MANFSKRDLDVALASAKKAGLDIYRVEVDKDGKLVLFFGKLVEQNGADETPEALEDLI